MNKSTKELAERLGGQALKRTFNIVTAESCTGGMISAAITDISGSSAWFQQGFVTYSNDAKARMLGVDSKLIEQFGAVSEPVIKAMLTGAIKSSGADFGVAISGIAGPDGGTPEKPVGTVWLAWGDIATLAVQCYKFSGSRSEVRDQAVNTALQNCVSWLGEE